MKILVINQHTLNHGDEAAGRALVNKLFEEVENISNLQILYNSAYVTDNQYFYFDDKKVSHDKIGHISKLEKIFVFLTFIVPFFIIEKICQLSPSLNKELKMIKDADLVISAPGGVNIGPYKRWRYLWRLFVTIKLKKQLSIYSISFGPLPENKVFQKASKFVLTHADFISLRDAKSQRFANELKISYESSIDTAFLNTPTNKLHKDLVYLNDKSYIVIVPNQLTRWHPYFKNIQPEKLDTIYLSIINMFLEKNIDIILLPQLFGFEDDSKYFEFLKEKSNNPSLIRVIDPTFSSDVQQQIVQKSQYVVGARYHSIIFAINNKVPFFSLSYEHKMTNTLELLNLESNCEELLKIVDDEMLLDKIVKNIDDNFENRNKIKEKVSQSQTKAFNIAQSTFKSLLKKVM